MILFKRLDTTQKLLQYKTMPPRFPERDFFTCRGFSLIEILIAIGIIGLIGALLIPNFLQARQEALRQTIRQQVKFVEKALSDWFAAQPTLAAASNSWGSSGFANAQTIMLAIAPYMGDTPLQNTATSIRGFETTPTSAYTAQMQQSTGTSFIGGNTNIGSNTAGNATLTHAHIRFYWQPDNATTAAVNERLQYSPRVVLLLPTL
jgi:prepilin-type N-terminal cleavage/methylation domain-containing protein